MKYFTPAVCRTGAIAVGIIEAVRLVVRSHARWGDTIGWEAYSIANVVLPAPFGPATTTSSGQAAKPSLHSYSLSKCWHRKRMSIYPAASAGIGTGRGRGMLRDRLSVEVCRRSNVLAGLLCGFQSLVSVFQSSRS